MDNHGAPAVVSENIEKVIQVEEAIISQRSVPEKLADDIANFVGTLQFVLVQLVIFIIWIVINAGFIHGITAFDPFPYSLFSVITSFEAVIIAAIVLMKQNRMMVIADRREHLDLQVNLLTECEVTQVIRMLHAMGQHLGVEYDSLSHEYARHVTVDNLVDALHNRMPDTGI